MNKCAVIGALSQLHQLTADLHKTAADLRADGHEVVFRTNDFGRRIETATEIDVFVNLRCTKQTGDA